MLAVGAQPTWQVLHGDECVVLNVSTMEVWESRTYDGDIWITDSSYPGRNTDFDNQADCLRYYNYNYNKESKEGRYQSYRYTEQVKHMCVPCSTVYGGAVKADCTSRTDNARKLGGDRGCFEGNNADLYDDLGGLLPELDCGIYLGEIMCQGNEIRLTWYSKDQNGTRINVPSDRRESIDRLYSEMKARSKERKAREIQRQLEQAQRREDVAALINEMTRLVEDIKRIRESKEDQPNAIPDPWSDRALYEREPSIADKPQGAQPPAAVTHDSERIAMDTDGDGVNDMEAIKGVDGQITYRDLQAAQAMEEIRKVTDVNAMLDLGANDPEVIPIATDGWLRIVEKEPDEPQLTVPRIFVNNGILTSPDEAIDHAKNLADRLDKPVVMSYSATKNPIDDMDLAREYYNGRSDAGTRAEAEAIYEQIKAGEDVLVIAHSRGFARTQCVAKDLEWLVRSRNEVPVDALSKVSVVGVGAFANPKFQWPDGMVVVKAVNRTDPVPEFSGDRPFGQTMQDWDKTFTSHSFSEYYRWVQVLADPRLDLRLLNGWTLYDEDYNGILQSLGR